MKNLIYYIAAIGSVAAILYLCEPVKPPVKTMISGVVTNPIGDVVKVFNSSQTFTSTLNDEGEFVIKMYLDSSDYFNFHHGREVTVMYVHPGNDIGLTIDTDMFDETIEYSNSEESSYLAKKFLIRELLSDSLLTENIRTTPYESFVYFFDKLEFELNTELRNVSNQSFVDSEKEEFQIDKEYWYEDRKKFDALPKKGEPAIEFSYPDQNGDIVALSDFSGKYVYVDVWATWCGPCRYEIPFLVNLEKEYHEKNIVFVSVSVDSDKNKQAWLDMIDAENMGGVQLFASSWSSEITTNYLITTIPRFMLFDPSGNVFTLNAPRPSSEEIRVLFDEIL